MLHQLSDRFVQSLRLEGKAYLCWDSGRRAQKGLAVNVQPSGYKSYYAIYNFRNRVRWYFIADVKAITVAQARKLAQDCMYQVAQGMDPQAERRASRHGGTFEDLAKRYVEEHAKKQNKSWESTDDLIKTHALPKLGKLPAGDITRSDIKALKASIAAPILCNQVLASVSAIFSWAIREEIAGININPCKGVARNATTDRERVLSDSEVPLFWEAFDQAGLVRSMALRTILLTGQRPGEVSRLHTSHIKDGWWEMPGRPVPALQWKGTKNKKNHRVFLPQPVLDIIAELEPDGFVFANSAGNPIDKLDTAMREICTNLKIDDGVTPHDLRRTHGTSITGLGFGRDAMNRVQNHKSRRQGGKIADVYDQYEYREENKKIMTAVANKIMTLVESRPDNVIMLKERKSVLNNFER